MSEVIKVYTEEELRRCHVGKYVDTRIGTAAGADKTRCYRDQGVYPLYLQIRGWYKKQLTDETGYVFHDLANQVTEKIIDTYLILRARGKPIAEPVVPGENVTAVTPAGEAKGLLDLAEFGDSADAEMDPIRDLTWIYNNIAVRDVKPSDAPSPGAYAHLKFVQQNEENKVDFFTKVYPRIIPAKSQVENLSKFNDDNRATFDLLGRLSGESEPV